MQLILLYYLELHGKCDGVKLQQENMPFFLDFTQSILKCNRLECLNFHLPAVILFDVDVSDVTITITLLLVC